MPDIFHWNLSSAEAAAQEAPHSSFMGEEERNETKQQDMMTEKQCGVECLQVLGDFRRIYDLIDGLVYSLQSVRRHTHEAEEFVTFLEDQSIRMHDKGAVLYPDSHNQLGRALHKHMHQLEELLRSAQELMNELAEPFRIFTRATERLKTLREQIEKTVGLIDVLLQFVPPNKLEEYGEPLITLEEYDPLPEKWYEPPPAAEMLLEYKSSSSRGEPGKPMLARSPTLTGRVLDEVQKNSGLLSGLLGYADNRPQLSHTIESLTSFATHT
ncbi:hypothetical protein R1sor_015055 [Riccia sorocarpa]|uniref:Uncharacterized protein n=1 Tax=Riccia sorocarpa TaxID=122646 RepID=A0ABD3HD02_9MARC